MDEDKLPRVKSVVAKRNRGQTLTREEQRQLDGYDAAERIKNRPYNRGAYVEFRLNKGIVEGSVVGSDDYGNYLVEFATDSQCVIKANTIVKSYLKRESTLVEVDEYVIGRGIYERIVNKEGFVVKFYDSRMESERVRGKEIILPESERTKPGSDWGMKIKY